MYESSTRLGAKLDLTNVLNLSDKLNKAERTITLENEEYLEIVDELETKEDSVDVYWNMVTSASSELVNSETIRLTQDGISMLLKFSSENEFVLEMDRSTVPDNDYETTNPGTAMVGFIAKVPPNSEAIFTVTLKEE